MVEHQVVHADNRGSSRERGGALQPFDDEAGGRAQVERAGREPAADEGGSTGEHHLSERGGVPGDDGKAGEKGQGAGEREGRDPTAAPHRARTVSCVRDGHAP